MDLRNFSLLLTLCVGASVGVLQVPLRRSAVSARTSEGSVLLYHTFDVTIGTPPQNFNLSLDLGDYYAYVFDTKLHQANCKHSTGQRRSFDRYSSSTYKREDDDFPFLLESDQYFDYCVGAGLSSGAVGRDVVSTSFAVIKQQVNASLQSFWPSDGVLGLTRREASDKGSSPIHDLATAAGGPVVTLFTGSDTTARPGVLTLGGTDTVNCDGAWTTYKQGNILPDDGKITGHIVNWNVGNVSSIKLGRLSTSQPLTAIVDSYTKAFVPAALFKQIVSTVRAEYDFASDEYVVACSAVKNLPDLVLTFKGGLEYRVPSAEYVKNLVPRKDTKCTLLIAGLPDENPIFILGWQMLSRYCWRFNYGANELAVAKSKSL